MFLEDEDWNDDKGEVLSPVATSPNEKSTPSKTKAVGKKSLLRTLQTLGSVPDWKREDRQRDSDSETETPPTEHAKKKRKKKRRKRKIGEETIEDQLEDGDLSLRDTEDTAPVKKKRKDKQEKKINPTLNNEANAQESSKHSTAQAHNSDKKLSRQQWKNRMKNKKKCKNKYKAQTPAEEGQRKETDSNCNLTKKDDESKVVKKKGKEKPTMNEEISKIQTPKEKEPIENKKNIGDEDRTNESNSQAIKQKFEISKKLHQKKERLRQLLQNQASEQRRQTEEEGRVPEEKEVAPQEEGVIPDPPDPSTALRTRMEQRLDSARFRYINEVLYSSSSGEARRMFSQDPQAFWVYHRGYSAQVQRWPRNPVDDIIKFIKLKPPSLVVADFGCGDCKIARSVKNKVHCFDLVATCDLVTACDMANVPLKDRSVDIAVFCLSLMGTNLGDFLKEANRVLKMGGFLKIAEVSSRFDNVRSFITALANLGFKMVSNDTENTHFYSFEMVKTGAAPESVKKFGLQLKPCLYKKR